MTKFLRGEKVKLKENFTCIRYNEDPNIVLEMHEYAGKEFTICDEFDCHGNYTVKENNFIWGWQWLEPVFDTYIEPINEDELNLLFKE